jgi:hypothetical protein
MTQPRYHDARQTINIHALYPVHLSTEIMRADAFVHSSAQTYGSSAIFFTHCRFQEMLDFSQLVDACVWASFFTKPSALEKPAVDRPLNADRIAPAGPILAEVLLGFRRKDPADWAASRLRLGH